MQSNLFSQLTLISLHAMCCQAVQVNLHKIQCLFDFQFVCNACNLVQSTQFQFNCEFNCLGKNRSSHFECKTKMTQSRKPDVAKLTAANEIRSKNITVYAFKAKGKQVNAVNEMLKCTKMVLFQRMQIEVHY